MIVHISPLVWAPFVLLAVPFFTLFSCVYVALCKKIIQPNPKPGVIAQPPSA